MDSTIKGISSDSYISSDDAKEYFSKRPYSQSIEEDDDFEKFLMHSTLILDKYTNWIGSKTTEEQALEWPRSGITGIDKDIIPEKIKVATCELALCLLDGNILQSTNISSFESMKISSISMKLSGNVDSGIIPKHIKSLVSDYGSFNSDNNVPIIRV